jgi:hypothetical protein
LFLSLPKSRAHLDRQERSRVARWYIFKPKIPSWVILEGLAMEDVGNIIWPFGLFYDHMVYFMAIWCILWLFDTFMSTWYIFVSLVYFSRFGMLCQEKSGNPG